MNLREGILTLFFVVITFVFASSQSNMVTHKINMRIPDVALLALVSDNSSDINFESTSPTEAGDPVDFATVDQNNDVWLNYSSINKDKNHSRKVVAILQGDIPAGMHLLVEASEVSGSGKGKLGISSGLVTLADQPIEIINNIGSCYTGKGTNNGHLLKYKLEFDASSNSYSQLLQAGTSFNVIYTLTDTN